jgi:N-acyl-L-homoserine lactone synthetase
MSSDHRLEEDEPAVVARMDTVARALAAMAAPIRFTVATSASDRAAVYGLRYQVVVEEGWIDASALPEKLERDIFDEDAIHLAGWDGDVLAATARLVLPRADRALPTEDVFGLTVEPRGQVVDLGRGTVARPYRGRGHRTFIALLSTAWLETRARGFTRLCGTTAPSMVPNYEAMGFHVEILGEPRHWWGQERLAIKMDGARCSAETLEGLMRRAGG